MHDCCASVSGRSESCQQRDLRPDVLENGSDKEMGVDCKVMAAEGKAKKGQGVSAKVLLTCRSRRRSRHMVGNGRI